MHSHTDASPKRLLPADIAQRLRLQSQQQDTTSLTITNNNNNIFVPLEHYFSF
jgi:hypothetical protein